MLIGIQQAKSFSRQRLLGQMPMVSEIGTQVDTHIVDTYIDPKYQWNEWELRRKALMLVCHLIRTTTARLSCLIRILSR